MIHKPKHPGQMVKSLCLKPLGLSVTDAAEALGISRPNLSKLLNGRISISPDMAVRLSIVFKTSDELWINLQAGYDLYKARQHKSKFHLKPLADMMMHPLLPHSIIHEIFPINGHFPNNAIYPLLIYKMVLNLENENNPKAIQRLLNDNGWCKSWIDSIYDYHHYHSNTHEVLVIFKGTGIVQMGGENGKIYNIEKGDVIIIPAGLAHKSLSLSDNFKCIGAYPLNIEYDMKYGKAKEHPHVDKNIKNVPLPAQDPIFGKNGLLFDYWLEK